MFVVIFNKTNLGYFIVIWKNNITRNLKILINK